MNDTYLTDEAFNYIITQNPPICKNIANQWDLFIKENKSRKTLYYDRIAPFINGYAFVQMNNKFGVIDEIGNEIIPCIYNDISNHGLINAYKKEDLFGFMNDKFEIQTDAIYTNYKFIDKNCIAVSKGKLWGLIDFNYNELTLCIYQEIRSLCNGFIAACDSNKWGYLDIKGSAIIPFIYQKVSDFSQDKTAIVKESHYRWHAINNKGTVLSEIKGAYDEFTSFYNFLSIYLHTCRNYYGVIDLLGNIVIDKCDSAEFYKEGVLIKQHIIRGYHHRNEEYDEYDINYTYICLKDNQLHKENVDVIDLKSVSQESSEKINLWSFAKSRMELSCNIQIEEDIIIGISVTYMEGHLYFYNYLGESIPISSLFKPCKDHFYIVSCFHQFYLINDMGKVLYESYKGIYYYNYNLFFVYISSCSRETIWFKDTGKLLFPEDYYVDSYSDKTFILINHESQEYAVGNHNGELTFFTEKELSIWKRSEEVLVYNMCEIYDCNGKLILETENYIESVWGDYRLVSNGFHCIIISDLNGYIIAYIESIYSDRNDNTCESHKLMGNYLFVKSGFEGGKNEKTNVYNYNGELITTLLTHYVKPYTTYIGLCYNKQDKYIVPSYGLYRYIENDGNLYEFTGFVYDKIIQGECSDVFKVKKNNLHGYVNNFGRILIQLKYDSISFKKSLKCYYTELNNQFGLISEDLKKIIPPTYDKIVNSFYISIEKDQKKGCLNYELEEILPVIYDKVISYDGNSIIVTKESKKGMYDYKGFMILPEIYDSIHPSIYNTNEFIISVSGKYGLCSNIGQILIPLKYDNCKGFQNKIAGVYKDGYWGFINTDQKQIISFCYEKFGGFIENEILVKNGDKWILIDNTGKCINNDIREFESDYSIYKLNDDDKWVKTSDSNIDYFPSNEPEYTEAELRDMYHNAFENDPSLEWNID